MLRGDFSSGAGAEGCSEEEMDGVRIPCVGDDEEGGCGWSLRQAWRFFGDWPRPLERMWQCYAGGRTALRGVMVGTDGVPTSGRWEALYAQPDGATIGGIGRGSGRGVQLGSCGDAMSALPRLGVDVIVARRRARS